MTSQVPTAIDDSLDDSLWRLLSNTRDLEMRVDPLIHMKKLLLISLVCISMLLAIVVQC